MGLFGKNVNTFLYKFFLFYITLLFFTNFKINNTLLYYVPVFCQTTLILQQNKTQIKVRLCNPTIQNKHKIK
jgi:hypothetical protein